LREGDRNALAGEFRDTFSLTPALSRWERESCSPVLEKAEVGDSTRDSRTNQSGRMLSPLPQGEGQGEGELTTRKLPVAST